jgi:hypothetical protein
VREFACDRHHGGVALPVRIEHHGRWVPGEAGASECIYLKNSQSSLHGRCGSFARICAPGYTSGDLLGWTVRA